MSLAFDIAVTAFIVTTAVIFIRDVRKFRSKRRKYKQTCFVYCPKCRNELVSSNSFIEDKDGIVKYKCDKCGNISFWDFIHYPVPYLRTCAENCKHFVMGKTGLSWCKYTLSCDPDTMVKFEPRMHGKEE